MFLNEIRADSTVDTFDPFPTPTESGFISSIPVAPIDNTPISTLGMVIIRLYAFGGLAFMVCVILASAAYWVWIVVIRGEYANSPPELDLHPEKMREKEKRRIERLRARKREKEIRRKAAEESEFSIPPLRFEHKEGTKNRSSPLPIKPIMHNSTSSTDDCSKRRKSSLSASFSAKGGKRVSWASSTSTLDMNGIFCKSPLSAKASSSLGPNKELSVFTIPSYDNVPNIIPKARPSVRRASTYIEPRSRCGQDMIAATTPEHVTRWSAPDEPSCFAESIDPLSRNPYNHRGLRLHRD